MYVLGQFSGEWVGDFHQLLYEACGLQEFKKAGLDYLS